MKRYLIGFFEEFDYPHKARVSLLSAFDRLWATPEAREGLSALLHAYGRGMEQDMKAALETMRELSALSGIHEYEGALLLFLCYTKDLEGYYRKAGLSREIYRSSMLDLKYKLLECKLVHNIWGAFVAWWFPWFFTLRRFGFGRLQFEQIPFGEHYTGGGITLTPESPVINVHIPRTGERLDRESTLASYRAAAAFFAPRIGDPVVFVCHSWLLFPKNKELLRPGSNLLSFISDFDIFKSGLYEDYKETWRLFDRMYTGDADALPTDTSLRRAYVDLIRKGEPTGWGQGVYVYKDPMEK